jgi:L-lactate dehydrogenase complex protein LldE
MRVTVFPTCLVDRFWPEVGRATVEVLERAGCEVRVDAGAVCCGQPAFNSGYRAEAARVARGMIESLESAETVVLPSGSCTAMVKHVAELFADAPEWAARAEAVWARTHELAGFLVNVLGTVDLRASWPGRVAWHDACHGLRELGLAEEPRRLLSAVRGLERVEVSTCDRCCGFGGTFSVKYPELSVAMLDEKLGAYAEAGVDAIVSGDVSCLMQIEGRLKNQGSPMRAVHLAEILASRSAVPAS